MLRKLLNRKADMGTLSKTLTGAMEIARQMSDRDAGAHHLMLSALTLDDGTARLAFERIGTDPNGFASAVEAAHARALPSIEIPAPPHVATSTPADDGGELDSSVSPLGISNVDATFNAAVKATHGAHNGPDGGGRLCGAYFVAGVASIEHGVAIRALDEMGIKPGELIEASLAVARDWNAR